MAGRQALGSSDRRDRMNKKVKGALILGVLTVTLAPGSA